MFDDNRLLKIMQKLLMHGSFKLHMTIRKYGLTESTI